MNEHIVTLFDTLVAASFWYLKSTAVTKIQWVQCTGWEKFAIFELNPRLSRKLYEIGPRLLWITYMKS